MCNEIIYKERVYSNHSEISDIFGQCFQDIYTDNNDHKFDNTFKQTIEQHLTNIQKETNTKNSKVDKNGDTKPISTTEIRSAIKEMKMTPGHDSLKNEHIIWGGESAIMIIKILYNAILSIEHIPEAWKKGLIVPLFKGGGKPKSSPDSYRPVSLLPVLNKLSVRYYILEYTRV